MTSQTLIAMAPGPAVGVGSAVVGWVTERESQVEKRREGRVEMKDRQHQRRGQARLCDRWGCVRSANKCSYRGLNVQRVWGAAE